VGCSERDEGVAPASWVLGGLGPGLRVAGERGVVAYAEQLLAAICGLGAASRIAKVPSVHAVVVLLRPAVRIGLKALPAGARVRAFVVLPMAPSGSIVAIDCASGRKVCVRFR
jgi:hypothetical protein